MKKLNKTMSMAATAGLFALLPAFAAANCNSSGAKVDLCTGDFNVADIIAKVTSWILGISGAVAVLLIIWGGFLYITAAGNEKRVETAKATLTYAVIGLIVILLAQVIVTLVGKGLLGALNS